MAANSQTNLYQLLVMIFLFLIVTPISYGQNDKTAVPNSWVVKFKNTPETTQLKSAGYSVVRPIFRDLKLWELTFNSNVSPSDQRRILDSDDRILYFHPNYQASWRRTPNDPDYPSQWGLETIRMPEAWDISTGGRAPNGDEIVVAIFDDGFQLDHPDLAANIWSNPFEIEDNGIDDDMNGYIDDVYGWNATEDNDEHRNLNHGTAVAGIIGAVGDNNNQVAGIHWDVKLLLTSGGRGSSVSLADVVLAYEYIYVQRRTYNLTQGERGAYVVVTNYSGGAPDLFPEDFPAICEIYDLLGQEGVLSVTSAPNTDTDVDIEGDLPSTCTSEYLIVVTNTDQQDVKESNAGYGAVSIDIGAPGEEIFTTGVDSNIDPDFSGASASAPHVAGVISLLYTVICEEAYNTSLVDPTQIAQRMRNAVFGGADFNQSLNGITTTSGRLNALSAITEIREVLGNCCVINITRLDLTPESCQDADDGIIDVDASGDRLIGNLFYSIDGINGTSSDTIGFFNRLDPNQYTLTIFDDENLDCTLDTSVSIQEVFDICPFGQFDIVGLVPNPSSDQIEIRYDLDELKLVQIQIHDALGRLVYDRIIQPELHSERSHFVNIRDYPQGIYSASIQATGIQKSRQFIVVR